MAHERFLEIAKDPAQLSLRSGCLVVKRAGLPDVSLVVGELSAVVLANPQCTITQPAMSTLMEIGVPLLVCDGSLLPNGLMLPLRANSLQTQRMLAQAAAGIALKKRLWQHVIRSKIRAQAAALEDLHSDDGGLRALAERVRSGDPTNVEATAAQRYWPLLSEIPTFVEGMKLKTRTGSSTTGMRCSAPRWGGRSAQRASILP